MIYVVALLLCTPALYYCVLLGWLHRKYVSIPGPQRSSFFYGNLDEIVKAQKRKVHFDQLTLDWHMQYGYTVKIFVFHKAMILTCDPDLIKLILLEHPRTFPKPEALYSSVGFLFGERAMGKGLVTETDYHKWLDQRSIINPAFHRKYISGFVADFNTVSDNLVHELHKFSRTHEMVDMYKYFHSSTMDVIAKTAFGLATNSIHGSDTLTSAVAGLLTGISEAFLQPFANWSPFLYNKRKTYRKNLKIVKDTARKCIQERLQVIQNDGVMPDDILSIMVKAHVANSTFNMDLILDNMITFFLAGEETSANTLSFIVMELARHPEVLKKLRNEVDAIVGNKTHISNEDVGLLKYCGFVIKETLRMYPLAGGTVRHVPADMDFKDMRVPAGAGVTFMMFSSSRHPDLVENPLEFNPERFDVESHKRIPQVSNFPFSLGPRSCIGQNFVMMEMKIILAKLLQHFNFTLDKSQSFIVKKTATLHPEHVMIHLTDR